MNKITVREKPDTKTDLLPLRMPKALVQRFKACEKAQPQLDLRGVVVDLIIKLVIQQEGAISNGRHSTSV
jgi:hypothetical protein